MVHQCRGSVPTPLSTPMVEGVVLGGVWIRGVSPETVRIVTDFSTGMLLCREERPNSQTKVSGRATNDEIHRKIGYVCHVQFLSPV